MTRRASGPRCVECRQPIDISDRTVVRRDLPAGLNMNRIHRIEANFWHAECWAKAEAWCAEVRAEDKAQQQADIRAFAKATGLPDPYAADQEIRDGE